MQSEIIGSSAYNFTDYQLHRQKFIPLVPDSVANLHSEKLILHEEDFPIDKDLTPLFPTLLGNGMKYFEFRQSDAGEIIKAPRPLRIGCVLSGGQAAGGHNVIMGLFDMAKKFHPESKVFGFLAGPHGVFTANYMEITADYMAKYRNMGGFDMIRSGRHKIETPEQFASSLKACTDLELDGLAVIGGDDSNTNACLLGEYFAKNAAMTSVIGCPKTIDGDLKNEHIQVSFGFDTATKVYSEMLGNLCTDAVSSGKYYHFVRLMGRSASHIALECALQTRVNCCLIGEEVKAKNQTLEEITKYVADIISGRAERGKNYGVILVPEGLIEFIPEVGMLISQINEILSKEFDGDIEEYVLSNLKEASRALFLRLPRSISSQLLLDRDPHGNVQVSKIDTERLLILTVMKELDERRTHGLFKGVFKPQAHFFGYEGRCALPSNFDSNYCYGIGMNACTLMLLKKSGYMSCIKNLGESDPTKWIAAGCPLPSMMGIERRKGKDKPVITKALVELDGAMFKTYEQLRRKWALLDCYQSPGPIQFQGVGKQALNYMVKDPPLDQMLYAAEQQEKYEKAHKEDIRLTRQATSLSAVSQGRIRMEVEIPKTFSGNFRCTAIKRYSPYSQLVEKRIQENYPALHADDLCSHFIELEDRMLWLNAGDWEDKKIESINDTFTAIDASRKEQKFAIIMLGNSAPGGNNVIDGLLKYQLSRRHTTIYGYLKGLKGLEADNLEVITEESFAPYRNLGGYDFLGKSGEKLEQKHIQMAAESCAKNRIDGLILVGATHTMTDATKLSQHFKENGVKTNVVVVPATLDGNIRHQYLQATLGFDTASKVYSQLIGNMLTDSASAIKYWYFIRLMGKDPSNLALECALKTRPNMVLISEEASFRGESIQDLVIKVADLVSERAKEGKNYGTVLIPEGLLSHVASFRSLMDELNQLFQQCKSQQDVHTLQDRLYKDEEFLRANLSAWNFSLYNTMPDFMRLQLINEQEISGDINLAQIETEKLMAYLVQQELKTRKAAGKYNGSFAPVTHFFGYQGRAAHPSNFDCQLGSTLGFAAAALLESGGNALAVAVKDLNKPVAEWRCGGVPILALLRPSAKTGNRRHDLTVPSQEVALDGEPYQRYKNVETQWRMVDHYTNPGPVQYADFGADARTESLMLYDRVSEEMKDQIKAICYAIHNQTMFSDHQHLLFGALSALKASKAVLDSTNQSRQARRTLDDDGLYKV